MKAAIEPNNEGKRNQQAGEACRDRKRRTKTARQEATSLTAIFTRPHFWSKQHWTDIQNKREKNKRKGKKIRKQKIKSRELHTNIKTHYS